MSNPGDADETPIDTKQQLVDHLAAGFKPKAKWRIGTEHEKFGFQHDTRLPPPYAPHGIRELLERIARPGHWQPILDRGVPIGLKGEGRADGASVSLEPAGQVELSGAPVRTLHETAAELDSHFAEIRAAAAPLGLGFAPLGHHPTMRRDQMPWMPKSRYAIMKRYMPLVGGLGLDMMTRTCTVQVNLDYDSEDDLARKLRVSLAFQPVATAMFANSPFVEGKPSGYLSSRARVWTDVDPDRTGMPAFMLEPGFTLERYVDWILDVPMYFVFRNGHYHDVAGQSFRRYMQSGLPDLPGERATIGDFADHVTTAFTDVRVKRFLEMRGADAGRPDMMLAQSAFWTGIFYDAAALHAADALMRAHDPADYRALRDAVPEHALEAAFASGTARDLMRDLLVIAEDGLRARACRDGHGADETRYLDPIRPLAEGGPTQAETWLEMYEGEWKRDASAIFLHAAI